MGKTWRAIERFLLRNQGATLGEIALAIERSKPRASYILSKMTERGEIKKEGRNGTVKRYFLTGKARAYDYFGFRLAHNRACFGTLKETSKIPKKEMKEVKDLLMEGKKLRRKAKGIGAKDSSKASELLEASSEKREEASVKWIRLLHKYMATSELRRSLLWLGGGLVYIFHKLEKENLDLDRKRELLKNFIAELYVPEMVRYWDDLPEKFNNFEIDGEGLGDCLDTLFKESKEGAKTLWEGENE